MTFRVGAVIALMGGVLVTSKDVNASTSTVLRPGSVPAIVRNDFRVNNVDNASLSYATQATHEEGTALAMDNATFRGYKLSGLATLDGAHYYPFYGSALSSAVPKQTSYPAHFAVVTNLTSPPGTPSAYHVCAGAGNALTFQKDSRKSPWRVSIEPYIPRLSDVPRYATSSHGYATALSNATLKRTVAGLPALYVHAFNVQALTGHDSALLPAADFRYGKCNDLGLLNPHQDSLIYRGLKLSFHASTIAPSDLSGFSSKGGGVLAMFTIREQILEVPTVVNRYVIWSHGATAWWSLLRTGDYGHVSWTIDQELAVAVAPPRSHAVPRVVGGYSAVLSVTGTPTG